MAKLVAIHRMAVQQPFKRLLRMKGNGYDIISCEKKSMQNELKYESNYLRNMHYEQHWEVMN